MNIHPWHDQSLKKTDEKPWLPAQNKCNLSSHLFCRGQTQRIWMTLQVYTLFLTNTNRGRRNSLPLTLFLFSKLTFSFFQSLTFSLSIFYSFCRSHFLTLLLSFPFSMNMFNSCLLIVKKVDVSMMHKRMISMYLNIPTLILSTSKWIVIVVQDGKVR